MSNIDDTIVGIINEMLDKEPDGHYHQYFVLHNDTTNEFHTQSLIDLLRHNHVGFTPIAMVLIPGTRIIVDIKIRKGFVTNTPEWNTRNWPNITVSYLE